MIYKKLNVAEASPAFKLAWKVFCEFEAPEYPDQGIENFKKCLTEQNYINGLQVYSAYDGEKIVGMLATRSNGNHIALFFVDGSYHKRGIGKQLFTMAVNDNTTGKITVNSSPYAHEVYHHLGFVDTDTEQLTDGIRYIPMEFIRKQFAKTY